MIAAHNSKRLTRELAKGILLFCVSVSLAGCGCDAPGDRSTPASTSAPLHKDPRLRALGLRHDFGVGAQATFFALGDTTSTISKHSSPFRFVDLQEKSGVDFTHFSGMDDRKLYPTAFGSGVGIFDYDGDGRLDLYFATCTELPIGTTKHGPNRLYKNVGGGRFRDVTDASGLGFAGFCHGIIAGDIDNDGDADVFLCNYGANALFLNRGDGTFLDISHSAGIDRPNWSSGGAMLDYDNDGDLDIYVANYGEWIYPRDAQRCSTGRVPLFCSPRSIGTVKHILYRNNGNRTFTDVTDSAGIGRSDGHGFGVVAADLNDDGWIDLYVANDTNPNYLFLNKHDGTFEDVTETSGAACDEHGHAQSSMGVDSEDTDGDGRPELLVTNFQNEHIAFYQNLSGVAATGSNDMPPVVYREASLEIGLSADSRPWVGWGCALADFDNDGWPDCFVANGHLDNNRKDLASTMTYDEPPLLFHNTPADGTKASAPSRRFALSTRDVGPYFSTRHVARGAAFGDLDDDGDIDIVVNHMDGRPAILSNTTPSSNRWIRLKLVGTVSNRDAIGARVDVEAGGRNITRQRKGGCSMQSTNDPRILIGLGNVDQVDRVSIRWPAGRVSVVEHLRPDETYEIVEPRLPDQKSVALVIPRARSESN
jgi:enediyne biosynthesis protein E4